jgi:hypothetical protein
MNMKFLCDSNYGENTVSFSPLRAYLNDDGTVTVINDYSNCCDHYNNLEQAAKARAFIACFLQNETKRVWRYNEATGRVECRTVPRNTPDPDYYNLASRAHAAELENEPLNEACERLNKA